MNIFNLFSGSIRTESLIPTFLPPPGPPSTTIPSSSQPPAESSAETPFRPPLDPSSAQPDSFNAAAPPGIASTAIQRNTHASPFVTSDSTYPLQSSPSSHGSAIELSPTQQPEPPNPSEPPEPPGPPPPPTSRSWRGILFALIGIYFLYHWLNPANDSKSKWEKMLTEVNEQLSQLTLYPKHNVSLVPRIWEVLFSFYFTDVHHLLA
jgi:hypothetical protein